MRYTITADFNKNAALIARVDTGFRFCVLTNGEKAKLDFEVWQAVNDPLRQKSSFGEARDTAFFTRIDLARNFLSRTGNALFPTVLEISDGPASRNANEKIYNVAAVQAPVKRAPTILS
jgi:hypothetical protein